MKDEVDLQDTGPRTSAPPCAAAMGYNKLIFSDDFTEAPDIGYGADSIGHKWSAGMWWYPPPDPSCYVWDGKNCLDIIVQKPGASQNHVDLCTQWWQPDDPATGVRGGTSFEHGYFEARMCCFNWAAFWLFCWQRPWVHGDKIDPNNPLTWTNEIDIIEGDPGLNNRAYATLHKNTSSEGGVPDEMNNPNWFNTNALLSGYWHNYGLLWHPNYLTWFIDSIPFLTLSPGPYPSTNQPCQLILTAGDGGVGGSPSKTHPSKVRIDWVQVWKW